MLDYEHARHRMVEAHVVRRGVRDDRVLSALRRVPREAFVDAGFEEFAYEDSPLPIRSGQTISQPFIVARMAEAADLGESDRVLEIGTGSGYAAAVLAELAAEVFTIERHRELAEAAEERLHASAYRNVFVKVGDGTKGWPEKAPFDAILVAADGPSVPVSLQEQLEIGGRLVIPVGDRGQQRLLRVTRVSANKFEEDDLGGVMFVPLIGMEGWLDEAGQRQPSQARKSVPQSITEAAEDLPQIDDQAFGAMFDRFGDRRVVLLGEASHGTSEFYRARAAITKQLIEKHGFTIVAVEADWPDAAYLNRLVRGEGERPYRCGAHGSIHHGYLWVDAGTVDRETHSNEYGRYDGDEDRNKLPPREIREHDGNEVDDPDSRPERHDEIDAENDEDESCENSIEQRLVFRREIKLHDCVRGTEREVRTRKPRPD